MTFSMVACDVLTGEVGVAGGWSTSGSNPRQMIEAGVGGLGIIVCHGGSSRLGPALEWLADGTDPREIVLKLASEQSAAACQIVAVDARGRTATHSGRG